ncbi:MAG: hypothetical protein IJP24_01850 [Firmicutes bacterium]|nr:hypothetical protein [Bacillota bacterium]
MKKCLFRKLNIVAVLLVIVFVMTACGSGSSAEWEGDFPEPVDAVKDLSDADYISVDSIEGSYVDGEVIYVDAKNAPFVFGGIVHPDDNGGEYYRLDASDKDLYSSGNRNTAYHTAGATLRFRTNADHIFLKVSLRNSTSGMEYFTDRGIFGFDIYTGTGTNHIYCGATRQLFTNSTGFTEMLELPGGYQEVTVNLPLYAGINKIEIGFPEGAEIAEPTERAYAPVCFYGSSITQGGCVSRPGLSYSHIICRMLNVDNFNLGFSSSAKGEQSIAEYIASREISAFVMDYDHNNSINGLRETHYDFYKTVREAHPDIPIIMVTAPTYYGEDTDSQIERQEIIKESYDKAVKAGDDNVYYISGSEFFPEEMPDLFSSDMLHPNDLGHYYMAKEIFAILKPALEE